MRNTNIEQTITLLAGQYGEQRCEPNGKPLDEMVRTILSQNTSDANSGRAYYSLKEAFPDWESILKAPADDIADSIRVGGLGKIKAARIKQALSDIKRLRGELDLDFLSGLPIDEARAWLRQLPGVGAKTANCVLLFSLCRPALPVDTHVFRVSMRLGFIDSKVTVETAHLLLEGRLKPEQVYQFHVLMIGHGRKVCKAQRPRCTMCVLGGLCPSYKVFVGSAFPASER